ncbi:uncharacterized protein LOC131638782 [Vicia villosa]|uniref:uncharacterized protein LOC131638782 n=1 Tax=Vicia villosa TaxID=3911 RepID=UPI00273C0927|nr:uncharacterized protein LOC131638782 [Vicia villosa]
MDKKLVDNHGRDIEGLFKDRWEVFRKLWNCLNSKESMLRLNSRQLWLKDGEKNTRFFFLLHNSLLEGRNGRVEGMEEIKEEVKSHFEMFFKEEDFGRAMPEGLVFNTLSDFDIGWIERPFTEEVKLAIWSCNGNKSVGPDGYSFQLFQQNWEVVKEDVLRFISDFYDRGKLVSKNQTTFVPGRSITDGVLVVNEVLDFAKRTKRSCVILKVDFEKAYDSISWKFLRFVLTKMGFDVLTGLMKKAIEIGDFKGIKINEDVEVNMLQFADDTIIIGEGDTANLWSVKYILRGYEMMFVLKFNFHKSKLYGVNGGDWFLKATSSFLSCKVESLPFKFLGVKVGSSPRNVSMWRDLITLLKRRLAVWKDNSVVNNSGSIWWRDLLLSDNYILLSENNFAGAVNCRVGNGMNIAFWFARWAGSHTMMETNMVLFSRVAADSVAVADAGLCTNAGWEWQLCNLLHDSNDLSPLLLRNFTAAVQQVVLRENMLNNVLVDDGNSFVAILHTEEELLWSICDGSHIKAMNEPWLRGKEVGYLEGPQRQGAYNITVKDLMLPNVKKWDVHLISDLFYHTITKSILQVPLIEEVKEDRLIWKAEQIGMYSVRSGYRIWREAQIKHLPGGVVEDWSSIWNIRAPPRVKHLLWRICRGCLPTRLRLQQFHVQCPLGCQFCEDRIENDWHVLFGCNATKQCWQAAGLSSVNI